MTRDGSRRCGGHTGQAVTSGDPSTGHCGLLRRAIVGISSCNVCTPHPKRRCLITLHYNLAESLSHQDHCHYHTNTYFHHFPVDNYGVLDFYKSWVDTCERWVLGAIASGWNLLREQKHSR